MKLDYFDYDTGEVHKKLYVITIRNPNDRCECQFFNAGTLIWHDRYVAKAADLFREIDFRCVPYVVRHV